jgi:hypothetical protein
MIVRLEEQVHVVALHAEVQDAESLAVGRAERATDDAEGAITPEGGNVRSRSQRDVRRTAPSMERSAPMRDRSTARPWLWAGAVAATAPATGAKAQLELPFGRHLDRGINIAH